MAESTSQPEPWDRQDGEPNLWFARFESYRLAGPGRSVAGTWMGEGARKGKRRQGGIPGAWSRAAARWRWKQRAEAWDEHERQKAREAHAQGVAEMNQRHIQEAMALQAKGIERLKSLDLKDMSAADVIRYLTEASKLER